MRDRSQPLEIRTFASRTEIENLQGFQELNPVTKANYRGLVGDYELPERTQCCFQPPRRELCKKLHNRGFVVVLADGTLSIIGNVCADTKFDAQTKLAQDRNLYENLRRRVETQKRLAELLLGKEEAQAEIRQMFDSFKVLSNRMDSLLTSFGTSCTNQLRMLARGGLGRVMVTGLRIRRETVNGEEFVDRERIAIPVGTLRGITVLRTDQFNAVKENLRSISHAFDLAAGFTDEVRTADLARVTSTIADLPRALEAGNTLLEAEIEFQNSDWSALPFLVRDDSDRTKLARVVIGHAGNPGGRDKAKQWLQQLEMDLRKRHGVDRLEIAY